MTLVVISTLACPSCNEISALLIEHQISHWKLNIEDEPTVFRVANDISHQAGLPQVFDAMDRYIGEYDGVKAWLISQRSLPNATEQNLGKLIQIAQAHGRLIEAGTSSALNTPLVALCSNDDDDDGDDDKETDGLPKRKFCRSCSSSSSTSTSKYEPGHASASASSSSSSSVSSQYFAPSLDAESKSFAERPLDGGEEIPNELLSKVCRALLHGPHRLQLSFRWLGATFHRRTFRLKRLHQSIDNLPWLNHERYPTVSVVAGLYRQGYFTSLTASEAEASSSPEPPAKKSFRFVCHSHAYVLNYLHQYTGVARPASVVAHELNMLFLRLCDRYVSSDGCQVDYQAIANSPEFTDYSERVHELQAVNLDDLSVPARKAFFLNLYNALIIHAKIATANPKWAFQRSGFFTTRSYCIDGLRWTLDDIEHGALRANQRLPGFFTRYQFSEDDPRLKYALQPDPRIHFALVCGAKSCPPLRSFDEAELEESLDLVTRSFCEQSISIDHDGQAITLSLLFKWYKSDFGSTDAEVVAWIARHHPPLAALDLEHFSINYSTYDWTSNGKFTEQTVSTDEEAL